MTNIEKIKTDLNRVDLLEKIRSFKNTTFSSMTTEDIFKLKWYGIIHEPVTSDRFMLRVRSDGGRLNSQQLRAVAKIAKKYARGFADLTTRQTLQFHWLKIGNISNILDILFSEGLTTKGSSGDTMANILECPLAGIDKYKIYNTNNLSNKIVRNILHTKEFLNLPRKFKISINGKNCNCIKSEVSDIGFVAVKRNNNGLLEFGFKVLVGGGLGHDPMFAKDLGIFLEPENVQEFTKAVLRIYKEYGNRENRNRARFKYLVDGWGIKKLRHEIEQRMQKKLESFTGSINTDVHYHNHIGVHTQKGKGLFYKGVPVAAGRIYAEQLEVLADVSEKFTSGNFCITTEQNIVMLDIPEKVLQLVDNSTNFTNLDNSNSFIKGSLIACEGSEFCKFGQASTKDMGFKLISNLAATLENHNISINISGCPNGCAGHVISDIGLVGSKVKDSNLSFFNIYAGGKVGSNPIFGRLLKEKVSENQVEDCINNLLSNYSSLNTNTMDFHDFCSKHSNTELKAFLESSYTAKNSRKIS